MQYLILQKCFLSILLKNDLYDVFTVTEQNYAVEEMFCIL